MDTNTCQHCNTVLETTDTCCQHCGNLAINNYSSLCSNSFNNPQNNQPDPKVGIPKLKTALALAILGFTFSLVATIMFSIEVLDYIPFALSIAALTVATFSFYAGIKNRKAHFGLGVAAIIISGFTIFNSIAYAALGAVTIISRIMQI